MNDLAKLAEEECYQDMVKLLHHTIHLFVKQYGALEGYQELTSIANELWVQAHRSHDAQKGGYSERIRYKVWNGLVDHLRKLAWRSNLCRQHNVDFRAHDRGIDTFDLGEGHILVKGETALKLERAVYRDWRNEMFLAQVLDGLSDDAKGVVRLVIDPPEGTDPKRARTPTQWRSFLSRTLREMGWGARRIAEAFSEISRAIG